MRVSLDVTVVAPIVAPAVAEEPVISPDGIRAVADELDG